MHSEDSPLQPNSSLPHPFPQLFPKDANGAPGNLVHPTNLLYSLECCESPSNATVGPVACSSAPRFRRRTLLPRGLRRTASRRPAVPQFFVRPLISTVQADCPAFVVSEAWQGVPVADLSRKPSSKFLPEFPLLIAPPDISTWGINYFHIFEFSFQAPKPFPLFHLFNSGISI